MHHVLHGHFELHQGDAYMLHYVDSSVSVKPWKCLVEPWLYFWQINQCSSHVQPHIEQLLGVWAAQLNNFHPSLLACSSAGGLRLATNANNAVSTPSCGSCAAGFNPFNASAFNGSAAGFRLATPCCAKLCSSSSCCMTEAPAVSMTSQTRSTTSGQACLL